MGTEWFTKQKTDGSFWKDSVTMWRKGQTGARRQDSHSGRSASPCPSFIICVIETVWLLQAVVGMK